MNYFSSYDVRKLKKSCFEKTAFKVSKTESIFEIFYSRYMKLKEKIAFFEASKARSSLKLNAGYRDPEVFMILIPNNYKFNLEFFNELK